jgi:hypothetical protein
MKRIVGHGSQEVVRERMIETSSSVAMKLMRRMGELAYGCRVQQFRTGRKDKSKDKRQRNVFQRSEP